MHIDIPIYIYKSASICPICVVSVPFSPKCCLGKRLKTAYRAGFCRVDKQTPPLLTDATKVCSSSMSYCKKG